MAMHFIFSDTAVLLFDFWSVHSPAGQETKAQRQEERLMQGHTAWPFRCWCSCFWLYCMKASRLAKPSCSTRCW
ncbi:SLC31A2 isoform 1 [Pongo abelii]|uniref:SLC31A2 isoform 1 n=1 Tax=Pongo abelii TaxID=9601 RepID=A0A2J8WRV7_PONAB|nr:SLC31A2 isoform 1 [Pongo abelii]